MYSYNIFSFGLIRFIGVYTTDWSGMAKTTLKSALKIKPNNRIAKNVIIFIGDGMGLSTINAARIYKGQKLGNTGEETTLEFETFPNVALAKVRSHFQLSFELTWPENSNIVKIYQKKHEIKIIFIRHEK